MSKRSRTSYRGNVNSTNPIFKSSRKKVSPEKKASQANDARNIFLVLGIGVVLLVLFLYFIFVGRG